MLFYVIKAMFALSAAVFLIRHGLKSFGSDRLLWLFIALAPLWDFVVSMGLVMGILSVYQHLHYLQYTALLLYTAPVVATWLAKEK